MKRPQSLPKRQATENKTATKRKQRASFWRNPLFFTMGIMVIFGIIGLAAHWPIYPGDPSRLPTCACLDPAQAVWFLRWTPFAIAHGQNPLFTHWLNFPFGANLAQNTSMPLLGVLFWPLTSLVSPVASYNLIAWLAFPLSAGSMYYVIHRLTGSRLSAFFAGLLYGFSPYMIGQDQVHIMLGFIPLPPLILLSVWELLIAQRGRPLLWGLLLAAEVIAQFFIEPEVLAVTAIALLIGLVLVGLLYSKLITKSRLWLAGKGVSVAVIVAAAFIIYPAWFMIAGPHHFTGPNFPVNNMYRSDFLGLVAPTQNERVVPANFQQFATNTLNGDYQETGDYVGVVLLIVVSASIIYWRRNRWIAVSSIAAFLCWVLSLGPTLVVNGVTTSKRLPFDVLVKFPFIQDILPSRFSLGEWLFLSISVALIIVELQREYIVIGATKNVYYKLAFRVGAALVVTGIIITLLPRWPYATQAIKTPPLFKNGNHAIAPGTVALTYPFPVGSSDQAMLWQATDNMQFKLIGGYIQTPNAQGRETQFPPSLSPPSVESWLKIEQVTPGIQTPQSSLITTSAIQSYIRRYDVGVIIVDPHALNAATVAYEFTKAVGPSKTVGGVLIWSPKPL